MRNQELFGDSSSDESDEENDDKKEETPKSNDESKPEDGKKSGGEAADGDDGEVEGKENENEKMTANEIVGDAEDSDEKEGDGSDNKKTKPRRPTLDDSSSDEDDAANALFDDVVGSSAPAKPKTKPPIPVGDGFGNDALITDSGAPLSSASKVVRPPKEATILKTDRPDPNLSLYMTKLPNLIGIQPQPFDPNNFYPDQEEESYRGHVHNMIRWRYKRDKDKQLVRDDEGELVRESNSRIVEWSDGSFTLHIGTEVFDIDTLDSNAPNKKGVKKGTVGGLNGFLYVSQKAEFKKDEDDDGMDEDDEEGGKKNETLLECMGSIKSRLLARPSSLQSKAHKSLTLAVRQRAVKRAKIESYVTQVDPEKEKAERIRNKTDVSKVQMRKNYSKSSSRYRKPAMSRRFLEDDEENYDSVNLKNLKRNADMDDDTDDYGEEDSDDDAGYGGFRERASRKRRARDEEEEEEELVFDAESDDEDDVAIIKAHKKKRPQQNIFDDDDD